MATTTQTLRSPGRPRDPRRDAAIRDAAIALLAEVGYERMSVDAIAAVAGVSKPTNYRRSRSALDRHRGDDRDPDQRARGARADAAAAAGAFGETFWWAVGLLLVAFAAAFLLPRSKPEPVADEDESDEHLGTVLIHA
jgi:hypothetical protein